jgi:hypothetical protein
VCASGGGNRRNRQSVRRLAEHAVEVGIGQLKTRAHLIAAWHDRPGRWTSDDLKGGAVASEPDAPALEQGRGDAGVMLAHAGTRRPK